LCRFGFSGFPAFFLGCPPSIQNQINQRAYEMIYDVNSPLYKSFLSSKAGLTADKAGKSAVPKRKVQNNLNLMEIVTISNLIAAALQDEKLSKGAKISAPPQPTSA
jgi:hypothetical protein